MIFGPVGSRVDVSRLRATERKVLGVADLELRLRDSDSE